MIQIFEHSHITCYKKINAEQRQLNTNDKYDHAKNTRNQQKGQ